MQKADFNINLKTFDIADNFLEDDTGVSSFFVGLFTNINDDGSTGKRYEVMGSGVWKFYQSKGGALADIDEVIGVYCEKAKSIGLFPEIEFTTNSEGTTYIVDFVFHTSDIEKIEQQLVI